MLNKIARLVVAYQHRDWPMFSSTDFSHVPGRNTNRAKSEKGQYKSFQFGLNQADWDLEDHYARNSYFWQGGLQHGCDERYLSSLRQDGLCFHGRLGRSGRDSLHFMYENDGRKGYIRTGAGTQQPRHYSSRIYCVLNVKDLIYDGFDLFLTMNGVVLTYEPLMMFQQSISIF